jgi:protein gp37
MTASKIEWTDRTWNPVTGCTKVSPGCDHCYAEGIARRFAGSKAFPRGFDVTLHSERLGAPQRWRKPSRVFVNSMSDLFHDAIPDRFIADVFAVMAITPRHTYQVLTKRQGRMRSLLAAPSFIDLIADAVRVRGEVYSRELVGWPLPNVWLGVSVEDQQRADLRIPALLDTPAAVRFLSCEPLLGPVDLRLALAGHCPTHDFSGGFCVQRHHQGVQHFGWVIVGGESGPGARPMHPAWVRQLRDQCTAAGVPFFFKQWGEWTPYRSVLDRMHRPLHVWEDDLGPDGADTEVCRLGKKLAGRELDGRTWDEFPTPVAAS